MTVQIAIKLPDALAGELDELVRAGSFDSRSQALRAGLETLLASRKRDAIEQLYRDALARSPETPQEIAEAQRLAINSISEEPWERWW
jgi:Arc/MetJ-type ribon-helix-helix transcriptional regulator